MMTLETAKENLAAVKRHLNITWNDEDMDAKLLDQMLDTEAALNHLLGAAIDYFVPGLERQLFMAYMLYAWNDCINEFENAYIREILTVRHKQEVKNMEVENAQ